MIFDLVDPSHPALSQQIQPFDFASPPTDPIQFAKDLYETMMHHNGLGLAANQCGFPYRAFALKANPGIVCFNPRIVDETTEQLYLDEGCLTFPYLVLKVKRPKNIKVRYIEPNGNVVTQKFIGMTARVFLHEYDHLQGINFKHKANPIHLERGLRQQKIIQRQQKRSV